MTDKPDLKILRPSAEPEADQELEKSPSTRLETLFKEFLSELKKSTRTTTRPGNIEPRWLGTAEAATYCGYSVM